MSNFNKEFFDKGINRLNTNCEKWDVPIRKYGENLLAMWVADMDFETVPSIETKLSERVSHNTYGYTEISEEDHEAFYNFMQRRHGIRISKNENQMLPCVVTGIKTCVRCFSNEHDAIVIQSPVYGPFSSSISINNRKIIDNALVKQRDNSYTIDFQLLENQFKNGAKLIIFCNPHNPVSKCWNEDELSQLVKLSKKYDVFIISDEIHADFVYKPNKFISVLSIAEKFNYNNVICLFSASKTFNIAGLQQAQLVTKNMELFDKIKKEVNSVGLTYGNIFALAATREAYNNGDDWLNGLIKYLDEGRQILLEQLKEHLPKVKISPIDATYLAWLDITA
ncbi:MAG: putative C-S lyase, partial [Christensenellaceae bacterium]|nr:putative C-S lyase [Christensenellaceae bacterium]